MAQRGPRRPQRPRWRASWPGSAASSSRRRPPLERPPARRRRPASASARLRLEEANRRLDRFDQIARDRLVTALALLRTPEFARCSRSAGKLIQEADRLTGALGALSDARQPMQELADHSTALGALLATASETTDDELLAARVITTLKDLTRAQTHLAAMLRDHDHPLSDDANPPSIAAHAGLGPAPGAVPLTAAASASDAVDRLLGLCQQVLGRLAMIAERVERAARLPPLPEPPAEPDGPMRDPAR